MALTDKQRGVTKGVITGAIITIVVLSAGIAFIPTSLTPDSAVGERLDVDLGLAGGACGRGSGGCGSLFHHGVKHRGPESPAQVPGNGLGKTGSNAGVKRRRHGMDSTS